MMLIFDFFAGTGSATQAFADAGHRVIKVEIDESFEAEHRDIRELTAEYLVAKYGTPDFIWASPPCQKFSVASCSKYWYPNGKPRDDRAFAALDLVKYTLDLIEELAPLDGFIIENPRGMLRKQAIMAELPRRTITYCQYGDTRMKPTDLWGYARSWQPRKPCSNGDNCHDAAPRGSRTGTQGIKGAKNKSMIPYELGKEILNAIQ
jgi:hypothetical protein